MFISMKFCCASNAAIKIVKIARTKIVIFQKSTELFRKHNIYFWTQAVLPIILATYLPV